MKCLKHLLFTDFQSGFFKMPHNVRRYVQLPQHRGGARFCTRDAMQDYAVITFFSRWQKP